MTAIHITMRHGSVSEELDAFVKEKVSRMDKYLKDSSRVDVVLDREHEKHKCEIIVHSERRGGQMVVKDADDEIHSCIDRVVEKMVRQLQKNKERRKDHRGARISEEVSATGKPREDADEPPSYEQIVKQEIKGD